MCDEQYDVSRKMRELFERKQQQRAAAKEYYRNIIYNPHRKPDGAIFDPALQRFTAMSIYHNELYKPILKNFGGLCLALIPTLIFTLSFVYARRKDEEVLRSGVIRYEDRKFKHIY